MSEVFDVRVSFYELSSRLESMNKLKLKKEMSDETITKKCTVRDCYI